MSDSGRNEKGHYVKGHSGNPLGSQLHDPELKKLKRLTSAEVAEVGTLILSKNLKALKDIVKDAMKNKDSQHSALKAWFAAIAVKAIETGNATSLDPLMNRITGKVKERIELSGADGGPIAYTEMTPEQLKEKRDKLRARVSSSPLFLPNRKKQE